VAASAAEVRSAGAKAPSMTVAICRPDGMLHRSKDLAGE
jgi:hypothetical protein